MCLIGDPDFDCVSVKAVTMAAVDAAQFDIRAPGMGCRVGRDKEQGIIGRRCTPHGVSVAVLEKEMNGRRSTRDCGVQSEVRESNSQRRRYSLVVITGFVHFFQIHS